jgi:hypothetical protein
VVTAGSSKSGAGLPSWDAKKSGCDAQNIGHSNKCEDTCVSDCAAARDDDKDTYPGVTLGVCGRTADDKGKPCNVENPSDPGVTIQGRAFAALEVTPKFTGTAASSCQLSGTVDTSVTYTIMGADVTLASSQISVVSALSALPNLIVKPDQSKLTMVRVDGKYASTDLKLDAADPLAACKTVIAKIGDVIKSEHGARPSAGARGRSTCGQPEPSTHPPIPTTKQACGARALCSGRALRVRGAPLTPRRAGPSAPACAHSRGRAPGSSCAARGG